jgi:thiosulfate/3-mercaptopyruvate sulfurtransferase
MGPQYTQPMMPNRSRRNALRLLTATSALALWQAAQSSGLAQIAQMHSLDPWSMAQATQPGQLAAILQRKSSAKPVILQVGFAVLYRSEHIPGSKYAGPASTPAGLELLKQTVANVPKNSDIYLYCGCCPLDKCPNIRPAFEALRKMGFTHLHVVEMQTGFGKDWVAHGYPVAGEVASAK